MRKFKRFFIVVFRFINAETTDENILTVNQLLKALLDNKNVEQSLKLKVELDEKYITIMKDNLAIRLRESKAIEKFLNEKSL
jgi:sensor histidine kinase YesM